MAYVSPAARVRSPWDENPAGLRGRGSQEDQTLDRRLVRLDWANPQRLLLHRPAGGEVDGLFDGHVELGADGYRVLPDQPLIELRVPPVFAVTALTRPAAPR